MARINVYSYYFWERPHGWDRDGFSLVLSEDDKKRALRGALGKYMVLLSSRTLVRAEPDEAADLASKRLHRAPGLLRKADLVNAVERAQRP